MLPSLQNLSVVSLGALSKRDRVRAQSIWNKYHPKGGWANPDRGLTDDIIKRRKAFIRSATDKSDEEFARTSVPSDTYVATPAAPAPPASQSAPAAPALPAAPTAPSKLKVSRTDKKDFDLIGSLIGGYEDLAVQIMVQSILQESDPCGRVAEICSTYSGTSALCSSGRVYELLNQFLGLYGEHQGMDKVPLESVPEQMRGGVTAKTWFGFCCAIFERLTEVQQGWTYEIPEITVDLNGVSIVLGPTSDYFWIVEAVERGFKSKTLAVNIIEIVDHILMNTFEDMDIAVRNVPLREGMWAVEEYDDSGQHVGVHRYSYAPYMLGAYDNDDLFENCMTSVPTVRKALEKWQKVKVNLDKTSLPRAQELLSAFLTIDGYQTTRGLFAIARPLKFATDMMKGALELASLLQTSSTKELETVHRKRLLQTFASISGAPEPGTNETVCWILDDENNIAYDSWPSVLKSGWSQNYSLQELVLEVAEIPTIREEYSFDEGWLDADVEEGFFGFFRKRVVKDGKMYRIAKSGGSDYGEGSDEEEDEDEEDED